MLRPRVVGLMLALATLAACAGPVAELETASRPVMKKRAAPEPVAPATVGAVRYEVVAGRARGLAQEGGIVRAVDAASGAELWLLQVYETRFLPTLETDKQEVFITGLEAAADGRSLLVDNERGRRYRIDLATRQVTAEPAGGAR